MRRTALALMGAAGLALAAVGQATAEPGPVQPPRSDVADTATNHTPSEQLDAYWTPSRVAHAKPATELAEKAALAVAPAPSAAKDPAGKPRRLPATAPKNEVGAEASVWGTLGRLVFTVPGKGDYICSANVVTSNNRDVIATARHCVMDIDTGQTYTNFRFAPGYDRGNAPHGWWNWRSMGWRVDDKSPGGDNAFIVLSTGGNGGGHVQDTVGSSGIGFNQPTNNYAHALGIPGDKDYAVWCEGMPSDAQQGGVSINPCNGLSGGASGGPFVVNYQSNGEAMQTASYFGSWGPAYWAYFRDAAWQVYDGAQHA
ncbi:trypsin-like serine peptidase [Streptomyces sp. NPDC059009]|uniref:trypsin-like serine peptidase n=1 Tax=Streptomyces sp. NPDC059009 TaxID=3346694 RepID=UPI0036D19778